MVNPYFHSFVLSQVFGLYLVIMAIIFAARVHYYRKMMKSVKPNAFSVLLGGSLGLLMGLFLVTIHNFWNGFAVDLLSLLFWFILIKSILVLSFPERVIAYSQKLYSGHGYYVMVILSAILGIVLMANGYYLYM